MSWRKITAVVFLLFSFSTQAQAASTVTIDSNSLKTCPEKGWKRKMYRLFSEVEPSADLKVFSLSFLDGGTLSAGFRPEVEPSNNNGLFTRRDSYYFRPSLQPSISLFENPDDVWSDFKAGPNFNLQIDFFRQFENPCNAFRETPYFLKQLPLNAQSILQGLKPGNLVVIRAKMGVVLPGVALTDMISGGVGINLTSQYLVVGGFEIHVLKVDEKNVRLKLIAIKEQESSVTGNFGYLDIFEITGTDFLNRSFTRMLNLKLLRGGVFFTKSSLFLVDYIFDITNPDLQRAYNQVILNGTRFNFLDAVNPLKDPSTMRQALLVDISPLESLYQAQRKSPINPTIDRLYRGSMAQTDRSGSLSLGPRGFRFYESRNFSRERLVIVDREDQRSFWQLNSFTIHSERSLFFSFFKARKVSQIGTLRETDQNFEKLDDNLLVTNFEQSNRDYSYGKYQKLITQLKYTLPQSVFEKIDFRNWRHSPGQQKPNVSTRYILVLSVEAMNLLPKLSSQQVEMMYRQFLSQFPELVRKSDPDSTLEDLATISKNLSRYLNADKTDFSKDKSLAALRYNNLFRHTGLGFLISLLPQNRLDSLISFTLDINSTDRDKVDFDFGDLSTLEIYRRILFNQNLLRENAIDLYLEFETVNYGSYLKSPKVDPSSAKVPTN